MAAKIAAHRNGTLLDIGANARVERCFRADAVDPKTQSPVYRWKIYRRTACAMHATPDLKRGKFVHPLHGQRTHDEFVWMPAGEAASKEEAVAKAQAFAVDTPASAAAARLSATPPALH